ncbi:GPR1/FUN34/YaaH family transporter [Miltoncostaea marina]|uniref:GPR1/FUN34/YaaH family transporter n=1 Tax=Miltoncostaea marina TaxID=2843215 RepID=UPI001C3D52C4|nr:GPR1/FUN34/YaaH family transporter [Miltoncostaea marina]
MSAAPGPEARVVLRPLATPLPLGFLALAGGTLMMSGLELGWIGASEREQVGVILLAFVVPLQLVSSVLGFAARDVVAGTAMGVLAGTWLSSSLVLLTTAAGARSDALGTILALAAVALLVPALAAAGTKVVPAAVVATSSARFAVTGADELGAEAMRRPAGVVGLALCALAVYAALALALEDARGRTVLPVGRRGGGRRAIDGSLADQLADVAREAGVRRGL